VVRHRLIQDLAAAAAEEIMAQAAGADQALSRLKN